MKNIYDLKLHQTIKIDDSTFVFRVAGGWIYIVFTGSDKHEIQTFVPYNNEFDGFKDKV